MEYVRDIIIVCTSGAVAAALSSPHGGKAVRIIVFLTVALTVVSPVSAFFKNTENIFKSVPPQQSVASDSLPYDKAVMEETASTINSYVRSVLEEKFGLREGIKTDVIFDSSDSRVMLSEVQIFTGVRVDSYRDREIEEYLSMQLGCDVFIFSE